MLTIESLSVSSMNSSDDCQWKFFLEYPMKFASKAGKKAYLGSCVHVIAEDMALHRKSKSRKTFDIKKAIETRWKEFASAPDLGFTLDPDKDFDFVAKQVKYIINSPYNPLKMKIVETEKKFEIEFRKPGFDFQLNGETKYLRVRGIIDLITELDKDTLLILDYKTGLRKDWITGKVKEVEDFEQDLQLILYNYAGKRLYPQYKNIIVTILYTSDGGDFSVVIPESTDQYLIDKIRKKFHELQNISVPTRLKDDKGRSDQWKCKFLCDFGKAGTCDRYFKLFSEFSPEIAKTKLYDISVSVRKPQTSEAAAKAAKEVVKIIVE